MPQPFAGPHRFKKLHLRALHYQSAVVVRTITAPLPSGAVVPAQVKSIDRLPSVLAWGETPDAFELLWRHADGTVAEGTVSNLFIVRHRRLVTPPVWGGVLAGVVRDEVLRLVRRLRFEILEQPFTRHELFTATEAFLTNSLLGLVPIRIVDGRRIGSRCPGPLTRRFSHAYAAAMRRAR